jgi:hypothetical protein
MYSCVSQWQVENLSLIVESISLPKIKMLWGLITCSTSVSVADVTVLRLVFGSTGILAA